jgi:hypothetical protein
MPRKKSPVTRPGIDPGTFRLTTRFSSSSSSSSSSNCDDDDDDNNNNNNNNNKGLFLACFVCLILSPKILDLTCKLKSLIYFLN